MCDNLGLIAFAWIQLESTWPVQLGYYSLENNNKKISSSVILSHNMSKEGR